MTIWPLRDCSNRQHLLSVLHCLDKHFVAFCLAVLSPALLRCAMCRVISCCVVLCCVVLCCLVLGLSFIVFFHITSCRVALCYAVVSRRVVLCCLMQCRAESCRVVLNCCCVVLSCNVLPTVWDLCFGSKSPRICQSFTQLNRLTLLRSISISISKEQIRWHWRIQSLPIFGRTHFNTNILLGYTSFLKHEAEYNGYMPRRRNSALV